MLTTLYHGSCNRKVDINFIVYDAFLDKPSSGTFDAFLDKPSSGTFDAFLDKPSSGTFKIEDWKAE